MYEIVIKKIELKQVEKDEWCVVGEKPVDKGEALKSFKPESYDGKMTNIYGHVSVQKEIRQEEEILKQTVEDLDLASVIKAINKI